MASSGSITTSNSNGYRNVTFQWSVKSQSVANNTTTISWSIVGAQNGSDGWYYAGPFNLTIDGTKVVDNLHPSGDRIQLRAGTVVKTGETTLSHAANGTKSFSATLTAAVYDLNDMSVSNSWSLDAIPRQSSASIASSYNIGSSHSISISRASSSYYHRISYKYGSESETLISSSATTSATLNLTSWGSKIPSAMSADVTIYLRTYPTATDASNNTNQIGSTATYSTSFVIPSYSQGTPSVTRAEANSSNTTGVYVQSISKLKFTISATANYGATLSYKVVVAGQTMTSNSNVITTTSAIATSGTVGATITVTDSRGKSASTTLNTTVVAYSAPKITVAKAARSASNAAQITCTISCSVSPIKNGSTEKNSMKADAINDTDTSFPSPSSTYQFSTSGLSASNVSKTYTGLSTSSTYYIQFRVVDAFGYSSQIVKVGLGGILHITKNGIGVMKRRESGALDVEGLIKVSGNIANGDSTVTTGSAWIATTSSGGTIDLLSHSSGTRGIWLDATSTLSGKYLISCDANGHVSVDGKTPLYVSGAGNQTVTTTTFFYEPSATNEIANSPRFNFYYTNAPTANGRYGMIFMSYDSGTANSGRFYFRQYAGSASGLTGGFDQYRLPAVASGQTTAGWYDILTTKSAITVGQGGTGATSAVNARNNLQIWNTRLKNGVGTTEVLITSDWSGYSTFIIAGIPGNSYYASTAVSKASIRDYSQYKWQINDETNYIGVTFRVSGTALYAKVSGSTTSGKTVDIYGLYGA